MLGIGEFEFEALRRAAIEALTSRCKAATSCDVMVVTQERGKLKGYRVGIMIKPCNILNANIA